MHKIATLLRLSLVLTLAVCSHAKVQTVESYLGPPLSRPDHIFVTYFSIAPDQVRLDQGVGARLMRVTANQPLGSQELQAARDIQAALAEQIVVRLVKYGLPAEVAPNNVTTGNGLLVQGQIVSIDQGNRTRRTLIGLGAGKSSVTANVQLYSVAGSPPPRFVMAFEGHADSGRAPGAAETMGAGAVAQRAATSTVLTGATHARSETHRATGTAEADQLAQAIAGKIGQFAVDQGWIQQATLK